VGIVTLCWEKIISAGERLRQARIEQGYFDAAGRDVVDQATHRGVLIKGDQTGLINVATRFSPAFVHVSHLYAHRPGYRPPISYKDALSWSLKLSDLKPRKVSRFSSKNSLSSHALSSQTSIAAE
jgi:hypothetical protein